MCGRRCFRFSGKATTCWGDRSRKDFDLQGLLDEISREYVLRALKQTGDRKTAAAKLLGFANHQTL
jgi:hypothetical protein